MKQKWQCAASQLRPQETLLLSSWNIMLPCETAQAGLLEEGRTCETETNHPSQGAGHAGELSKAESSEPYPAAPPETLE